MLKARSRWEVATPSYELAATLQRELKLEGLTAKVLAARGFDVEKARKFLEIDLNPPHDPYLLKGMKDAVYRIRKALAKGEKIRIFGDYDCDGVTSTAILVKTLSRLGGRVDYYIPNRFQEGYGLNKEALEVARDDEVDLLITVDTGISGWEEVAYAQRLGLDCIVTDHHQPPPQLPQALSVINPKQPGCPYPFKGLSGAGVALKVAQALLEEIPIDLLDLAALGTISDLVPLVDENRWIAIKGLERLNQTDHVGLKLLIEQSGLAGHRINEYHVGFVLGPRLNSCGRLESALPALRLLLSTDEEEAKIISRKIEGLNDRRQELVNVVTEEAVAMIEEKALRGELPPVLVVAKEGWHEGVLGIVASKLVERYYRPAIALTIQTERKTAKGSARSIEGFDFFQALSSCQKWLTHFGGHAQACGLTLPEENLAGFKEELERLASQWIKEEELKPRLHIDCSCRAEELTVSAVKELERLAPFGEGNPMPVLLVEGATLADMRRIGKEGEHLKCLFKLTNRSREMDNEKHGHPEAVGFGWGEILNEISPKAKVDVAGRPVLNHWNGYVTPQVHIADLRVTERQYFDWRGKREVRKLADLLPEGTAMCSFRTSFPPLGHRFAYFSVPQEGKPAGWNAPENVLLYDLPRSFRQLEQFSPLLKEAERVYILFHHESKFFSTWPTRDHFKWYYAFLRQRGSFDLAGQGEHLAKQRGWTTDVLSFMTAVFLELEFVKMKKGIVYIVDQPVKRELNQSTLYRQREEEFRLEQALLYSSQDELIAYLSRLIEAETKATGSKEEKVYGF